MLMIYVESANNMIMERYWSTIMNKLTPEESTKQETVSRVVKLVKVPTLTKEIILESYRKLIDSLDEVNGDVPQNDKYQDLIVSENQQKYKESFEICEIPHTEVMEEEGRLVGDKYLDILE